MKKKTTDYTDFSPQYNGELLCLGIVGDWAVGASSNRKANFCYNAAMTQRTWTPEELAVYRATAIRLREQDREAEEERRARAWAAARAAAELLRTQFGATRVVVFGSLAREDTSFTRWSDVDIAAWGLTEEDWLHAMGAVMDMDTGFEMNMVDVNVCKPSILESIKQEGIDV